MRKFDRLLTLDFETYYGLHYTLSKMTTEAYIRDPRFKAHMLGVKDAHENAFVVDGRDIQEWVRTVDWKRTAVLMHHAHFDGLILSHHYGVRPAFFFDTLSMARALHGTQVGGSLAKLAAHYGVGTKGRELANSKDVRDLPPQLYQSIAGYCANDVELTYRLFQQMRIGYPKRELEIIDCVVKMFTRPALHLDDALLRDYIRDEQTRKHDLLESLRETLRLPDVDAVKSMVMSNQQFADLLESRGVPAPMKVSVTTGKPTLALAKTDRGMTDLLEHPDEVVSEAAHVRLGVKSTINETRAVRMLEMGMRGPACIYLNYSGAFQTHRLSGGDKMNFQNFPSRDGKAMLRHALRAPHGTSVVACDSSNIELRCNMTAAGQWDVVRSLREGGDLYCEFAARYYGRVVTKADKLERLFGKIAILGLGYGMGDDKFRITARTQGGFELDITEAVRAVRFYRTTYPAIPRWWYFWDDIIPSLAAGRTVGMHDMGIRIHRGAIHLPTGMPLQYPDLRQDANGEWSIATRGGRSKVYGAKLVENITQALARNIVMEQTIEISKRYPVVLSVHDEVVFLCRTGGEDDAKAYAVEVMSKSPSWWPEVPLAAEASSGPTYGDAK